MIISRRKSSSGSSIRRRESMRSRRIMKRWNMNWRSGGSRRNRSRFMNSKIK